MLSGTYCRCGILRASLPDSKRYHRTIAFGPQPKGAKKTLAGERDRQPAGSCGHPAAGLINLHAPGILITRAAGLKGRIELSTKEHFDLTTHSQAGPETILD